MVGRLRGESLAMNTKHTPGPWRVEGRFVKALKEKDVAECPRGYILHGKVDEANARLIAAAPDLLHACKTWVKLGSCALRLPDPGDICRCDWHLALRAVAKAEGR